MADRPDVAIVLLAGGRASRFPGKLESLVDGEPMLLRAYRAARTTGFPVLIATKGAFGSAVDRLLDAPVAIDRWAHGGPLRALHSACGALANEWVFALAADAPRIDAPLIERIVSAREPGDTAVVPRHDGRIEPLAALYHRPSLLHESFTLFGQSNDAMHELIDRLKTRFIDLPAAYFANVNTPADLAALSERQ
ncbi:MAG: molybdenum cofactor guanylyltransferase [Candidatus Eremiobacteraeota bacterium]|nr:molybdenum cofactor guanylyltransferase [Candidatus Eremiobacteraeota bacterium]MBV8655229.1 molybdenum cofactor guanylyltransferase [Candidatus Eremiobacteraeota bacterium]